LSDQRRGAVCRAVALAAQLKQAPNGRRSGASQKQAGELRAASGLIGIGSRSRQARYWPAIVIWPTQSISRCCIEAPDPGR